MADLKKLSIKLILGLAISLWITTLATSQSTFTLPIPNNSLSPLGLSMPSKLDLDFGKQKSSLMYQMDYNKVYHDGLGFFCKMEDKASARSQVQLRMRLGSLQYVDALEQKLPAYQLID